MARTILITGGAGFIGSNLVHYWRSRHPEDRILVLDALTYTGSVLNLPGEGMLSDHLEFWYGNVRNGELVDTLMSESDVVVHLAAEGHVTRSIYDNLQFFETDVLGSQVVANSVVKYRERVKRLIHVSTSEVYGTAERDVIDEEHPLNPLSPHAAAKAGADRLVYSYWRTYGIPAVIVRPFNNYGPHQHLEKVIPRFITSCLLDEPITVHGDGRAIRDFVHVEDTCRAIEGVVLAEENLVAGQVFNVGTGRPTSIGDLARLIRDRMGRPDHGIEFQVDRPGQAFRAVASSKNIRAAVGFKPSRSLEDGLDQTIAWYRGNRPSWEPQVWMRHIPIITATDKSAVH